MPETQSDNLIIIQALKEKLKHLSITEVAKAYGARRSAIYFHLDESRADNANIDSLAKIAEAIKKVEDAAVKKAKRLIKSISNLT